MGRMRNVQLFYFDAGGGHRASALALLAVIDPDPAWSPSLVNLQELLDPIDPLRRLTGVRLQDYYNLMLRRNWTRGAETMMPVLHAAVRAWHPSEVRLLSAHLEATRPDLVVSLIPNFHRALLESLRQVSPSTPLVTIITDIADYPPNFWLVKQDSHFICGSERAVQQAQEMGLAPEYIHHVSGMLVHPRFYQEGGIDRAAERQKLGLAPDLPCALVMFGGYGSEAMVEIARRLNTVGGLVQAIFICGRNEVLAERLRELPGPLRRLVIGYTREVPFYMWLSDFFVGKPGPGSISEALVKGLPVVLEKNARTMPQERFNADWVQENGFGVVVKDFRDIAAVVSGLIAPANFAGFHERVKAYENRAVFEVPELLRRIVESRRAAELATA
jgi:UDP-N-acetylglucosamine:LPS N-acetylglucosamine transferase